MTREQELTFREQGYLYLPNAFGEALVQPIRTHLVNELKRHKIWSSSRILSNRLKDIPIFQQVGKIDQLIDYPGLKDRLVPSSLSALMTRLAGGPLTVGPEAQLLISLPHQADWSLNNLNWHRDISSSKLALIPGIQVFALLDELLPQGGATLALAGAHRLKSPAQGKQVIDRLTATGAESLVVVDGIELSLLEMSGRAGDVYLMDMRFLHTPSINATKNVRIMATVRCFTAWEQEF